MNNIKYIKVKTTNHHGTLLVVQTLLVTLYKRNAKGKEKQRKTKENK
jgi:hypothetical protein